MKPISIKRAHLHNLKNIDIPTDKLVVVTGVSGSGKSSLVFDLVYEEGRRRYLQAIGVLSELGQEKGADHISGLRPTVAVTQSVTRHSNPRSVVGTRTGLLHYFGMLYADTYNLGLNAEDVVSGSHFSFNSPLGMCKGCQGRGHKFELNFSVLLPDKTTTLPELYRHANMESSFKKFMERISKRFGLDLVTTPFIQLPEAIQKMALYGRDPDGAQLTGLDVNLQHRLLRGANINNAMQPKVCITCHGYRLNQESLSVEVNGATFGEIANMSIRELEIFVKSYRGNNKQAVNTRSIILDRISSLIARLIDVKLDYLSLYRSIPTLSGGESQRLFLMSFLDSDIESLVYIFDEPTTGLHEVEKRELLAQILELKEQGNSLIIVEHDSYSIASAEHIIEVGPLAGNQGGNIVYQGDYDGLLKSSDSLTSQYLSGKLKLPARTCSTDVSDSTPKLVLHNVNTNNLKSVTATIPLGKMVGIAGVSGSGKSSLIADTLVPILNHRFDQSAVEDGHDSPTVLDLSRPTPCFETTNGVELISRCVQVGQEPIGRRTGSNPATYLGIWDRIRRIFAKTKDAKALGFGAGHFSFNTALGACEHCGGNGKHQQWLGSLWMSYQCASCKGQRYQPAVLEVRYKNLNITDILNSSITEAIAIFADDKPIVRVLDVLVQTGMGYLTLGQPTSTLSGGEAQRIKLAKELGRRRTSGNSLFVLDEPTTGLSIHDVAQMLVLLDELVSQGNTVLIIEHDPMVLSRCDWLLELGPGAGHEGGQLIAQGPPDAVKVNKRSVIAEFI